VWPGIGESGLAAPAGLAGRVWPDFGEPDRIRSDGWIEGI
jgi:hypothetical protein